METVIAGAHHFRGGRVLVECDNEGAVSYINCGGGKLREGRGPMLRLALAAMAGGFDVRAVHRSGEHMRTIGTDRISRGAYAGLSALPAVQYAGEGFGGLSDHIGWAVVESLGYEHGQGPAAPEVPAYDLAHVREEPVIREGIETQPDPVAGGGRAGGWPPAALEVPAYDLSHLRRGQLIREGIEPHPGPGAGGGRAGAWPSAALEVPAYDLSHLRREQLIREVIEPHPGPRPSGGGQDGGPYRAWQRGQRWQGCAGRTEQWRRRVTSVACAPGGAPAHSHWRWSAGSAIERRTARASTSR